jgi:FAD-dependent urate hydroxylase
VVGGNFAGLAAAIGLARNGFDVTVVERAPSLENLQQAKGGLHLWPNAMKALEALGAGERALDQAVVFDRSDMAKSDGSVLTSWHLDEFRSKVGVPTVRIDRGALHRALAETLREVAPNAVRVGTRAETVTVDEGAVTTQLDSGESRTSDLLVAADGVRSRIREQLFGPLELRSGGWTTIGTSHVDVPSFPERTTRVYLGRGVQFGLNRMEGAHFSWFIRTADASEDAAPLTVEEVVGYVHGWADPIEQVLHATDPDTMTRAPTFDAEPLPRWTKGRAALAGDAAHPMLNSISQGAAQGLEDGAALHALFAERGNDDIPGVLVAYEERRRERAADFAKRSRFVGSLAVWQNPAACAFRSVFMRASGGIVWKKMQQSTATL